MSVSVYHCVVFINVNLVQFCTSFHTTQAFYVKLFAILKGKLKVYMSFVLPSTTF